MNNYKEYGLEDFLSDVDFQQWVREGKSSGHPVWPLLLSHFPDKAESMEKAEELLKTWHAGAGPLTEEEVNREVNRIMKTTAPRGSVLPYFLLRVAAAVTVLALMAWSAWTLLERSRPHPYDFAGEAASGLHEVVNRSGVLQTFYLPDSSEVQLHPGARLRYSLQLGSAGAPNPGKREVFMTGTVFFHITKDSDHPFFVYSEGILTRVVGTSFTVRSSKDSVSVEVKTGQVAIQRIAENTPEEIFLTPNQRVTYAADRELPEKSLASDPVIVDKPLRPDAFTFDNTPLGEVFAELEHAYNIPIAYDSVAMQHCALSVRMGSESFYSKLDIICKTLQLSYHIRENTVVVEGEGCPAHIPVSQ